MEQRPFAQFSKQSNIKLLPHHLIDQIKAGEVIERPATLLKELIENALDADAKKIDVHIINNGLDLIQISDDGYGMTFEDLPLAFLRHATSKLGKLEDLYELQSYGFRGEALASMSSISRLTCTSLPRHGDLGGKIILHGGEIINHSKIPITHDMGDQGYGTQFFIKDLFFNTPARLKFIKSKISEKNHIKRIVQSYIITHPHVRFTIKWDNGEKEIFPSIEGNDFNTRILQLFYSAKFLNSNAMERKGTADDGPWLKIQGEFENHQLQGLVEAHNLVPKKAKFQFIFVNNRPIQDRTLHSILSQAMNSCWQQRLGGESYCLFLKIPPHGLDVNVHPNKTVVKFERPSLVYSLISASIKKALQATKKANPTSLPVNAKDNTYISPLTSNSPNERTLVHGKCETLPLTYGLHEGQLNFIPLSSKYLLTYFAERLSPPFYVLNLKRCMGHYCYSFLQDNQSLKDRSTIPFLIGRPFSGEEFSFPFEKIFPYFKEFGLELDRLNQNTLVLRSIPAFFDLFDSNELVRTLLLYLQDKLNSQNMSEIKKNHFRTKLEQFFLHELEILYSGTIPLQSTEKMIETLGKEYLLRAKVMVQLADEKIDPIFKGVHE